SEYRWMKEIDQEESGWLKKNISSSQLRRNRAIRQIKESWGVDVAQLGLEGVDGGSPHRLLLMIANLAKETKNDKEKGISAIKRAKCERIQKPEEVEEEYQEEQGEGEEKEEEEVQDEDEEEGAGTRGGKRESRGMKRRTPKPQGRKPNKQKVRKD